MFTNMLCEINRQNNKIHLVSCAVFFSIDDDVVSSEGHMGITSRNGVIELTPDNIVSNP